MDPFHERLARVGLTALAPYGFALAGGYAVQAYGILQRPSEDVDVFATLAAEHTFPDAVRAAIEAYTSDGLEADVLSQSSTFARLSLQDPLTGRRSKVELGLDWRKFPPTIMSVGPVLARDDAVANKVAALYSRGQARDYIDVDAALTNAGYTQEQLLTLVEEHDPGFEKRHFAAALHAVRRLPLAEFTAYGITAEAAAALVNRMIDWAEHLEGTT